MTEQLYDAALARAEAAGKRERWLGEKATEEYASRCAAESRLAEATTLLASARELVRDLKPHVDGFPSLRLDCQDWVQEHERFLSATPAQTAEPDIDKPCPHPERNGRHELYVAHGQGYRHICRACGATDVPKAPEHPDTIALRECREVLRETLAQAHRDLESARAERDTALKQAKENLADAQDLDRKYLAQFHTAREALSNLDDSERQLSSALARIAELEAEVDALNQRIGGLT